MCKHISPFRLVCHADSIYHLKEGSLGQQISELELIANELKSCLDASSCSFNKADEIKLMAKNVLQNASKVTLQPCESGESYFIGVSTFGPDLMSIGGWVPVKNFHENQKYIGTFGPPFFLLFAKNPEILLFLSLLFWIFKSIFENFCDFFEKILSVK